MLDSMSERYGVRPCTFFEIDGAEAFLFDLSVYTFAAAERAKDTYWREVNKPKQG